MNSVVLASGFNAIMFDICFLNLRQPTGAVDFRLFEALWTLAFAHGALIWTNGIACHSVHVMKTSTSTGISLA